MNDTLKIFFSRSYENKINKDILYYEFPHDEVEEYVKSVSSEPVDRLLAYIRGFSEKEIIKPADVFQFSKFYDATDAFCEKVEAVDNPGLSHFQVGKLLLDDGKERNDAAYIKYGENHSKLAKELGLGFEVCNTYYLSGIGYIYNELDAKQKKALLDRLILRSTLIKRMYQASENGNVDLRQFLYMLADSTYVRRKSNIKRILSYLVESDEYDFHDFIDNIQL